MLKRYRAVTLGCCYLQFPIELFSCFTPIHHNLNNLSLGASEYRL